MLEKNTFTKPNLPTWPTSFVAETPLGPSPPSPNGSFLCTHTTVEPSPMRHSLPCAHADSITVQRNIQPSNSQSHHTKRSLPVIPASADPSLTSQHEPSSALRPNYSLRQNGPLQPPSVMFGNVEN